MDSDIQLDHESTGGREKHTKRREIMMNVTKMKRKELIPRETEGRAMARYFIIVPIMLAMALVVACGSGANDDGDGDANVPVEVTPLAQGRYAHTATLLQDGRVLVVGGEVKYRSSTATAEMYDLNGTWSSAGSLAEARGEGHTATLLPDGRVLVVGDGNSVEVYDPSAGQWYTTGSTSDARMNHTATLLEDGRVLVAGGEAGRRLLRSAEVYDPSTGEWSATGDRSEKCGGLDSLCGVSVLLRDGRVLVVGLKSAEIYDPSTGSWSPTSMPPKGDLGLAGTRHGFSLTVLEDGRVLLSGGAVALVTAGTISLVPITKVDVYDPSTGTWSTASPMMVEHSRHAATLMPDGRVLVVGDRTAEMYDPATDTWSPAGELNSARYNRHTATLLGDGTVLVVGGIKGGDQTIRLRDAVGLTAVEILPATGWQ